MAGQRVQTHTDSAGNAATASIPGSARASTEEADGSAVELGGGERLREHASAAMAGRYRGPSGWCGVDDADRLDHRSTDRLLQGGHIGWRIRNGLAPALEAVALLVACQFAVTWLGMYLGLIIGNEQAAAQLSILVFPLR